MLHFRDHYLLILHCDGNSLSSYISGIVWFIEGHLTVLEHGLLWMNQVLILV